VSYGKVAELILTAYIRSYTSYPLLA